MILCYNGDLFLVENACPHRSGSLKHGLYLTGDRIECPMHHKIFHVEQLIARPTTLRLIPQPICDNKAEDQSNEVEN